MSSTTEVISEADLIQLADSAISGSDEVKKEAYLKLRHHHNQYKLSYGFLWRLARAAFQYSQTLLGNPAREEERKKLVFDARDYAHEAFLLKPADADVRKWCSLTLGKVSELVGTKERIKVGHEMKEHLTEAIKMRPEDGVLYHLLGRWCFNVAALSWIERKAASVLFGEPPTSSYEESLKNFMEAEKFQKNPDGWVENRLFIGKVYIALKDKKSAAEWLQKASDIPCTATDDRVVQAEAVSLLATVK